MADQREADRRFVERDAPAPFADYCGDADPGALEQMRNSLRLPSALRGALMPDAHRGYGLPIGGVLETEGTVIPYAVGVDIACRMKLSVLDLDPAGARRRRGTWSRRCSSETQFGTGAKLRKRRRSRAMDDERWTLTPLAAAPARPRGEQLGTSGSRQPLRRVRRAHAAGAGPRPRRAGAYVALLSHSGSRGAGAQIAAHYSKLARELHPELPKELSYLAWLDLDHDAGREYLELMRLMGDYASANHAVIHERVTGHLKAEVLAGVENHHNYAWTAERDGARGGRAPQGRDAGRGGRARRDPGVDGRARVRRARQGRAGQHRLGVPRRGAAHEPDGGHAAVQLEAWCARCSRSAA